MKNALEIQSRLMEEGWKLFHAEPEFVEFTGNKEADQLMNDLAEHPHAFVLGCLMDRQIRAERAWSIPYLIQK